MFYYLVQDLKVRFSVMLDSFFVGGGGGSGGFGELPPTPFARVYGSQGRPRQGQEISLTFDPSLLHHKQIFIFSLISLHFKIKPTH